MLLIHFLIKSIEKSDWKDFSEQRHAKKKSTFGYIKVHHALKRSSLLLIWALNCTKFGKLWYGMFRKSFNALFSISITITVKCNRNDDFQCCYGNVIWRQMTFETLYISSVINNLCVECCLHSFYPEIDEASQNLRKPFKS